MVKTYLHLADFIRDLRDMAQEKFKLKKPKLVYIFAVMLLLAPFGNVAMSVLLSLPREYWGYPEMWMLPIKGFYVSSWILIALELAAGASLFVQKKSTWLFAIGVLAMLVLYQFTVVLPSGQYPAYAVLTAVFATVAVMGILYFFRFPYLDRRDHWWGVSKRFATNSPLSVIGIGDGAVMRNISRTGLSMEFKNAGKVPKVGSEIQFHLPHGNDNALTARVVRVTGNTCGLQFMNLTGKQKSLLKNFIAELKTKSSS